MAAMSDLRAMPHDAYCSATGNAKVRGECDCWKSKVIPLVDECVDIIEDLVNQDCLLPAEGDRPAMLDSMALSTYADAIRFLAKEGRVQITHEYGRRVIAVFPMKEQ
jgi:hypothetical protein